MKVAITWFLAFFAWSDISLACKCRPQDESEESLKNALENASSVFLGTVMGEPFQVLGQEYKQVPFSVEKSWKGAKGIKAQVKVGLTDCSYSFEVKKKYLVFASDRGATYTSICSRTKLENQAKSDILLLDSSFHLK